MTIKNRREYSNPKAFINEVRLIKIEKINLIDDDSVLRKVKNYLRVDLNSLSHFNSTPVSQAIYYYSLHGGVYYIIARFKQVDIAIDSMTVFNMDKFRWFIYDGQRAERSFYIYFICLDVELERIFSNYRSYKKTAALRNSKK
jgi:hypothetical protein